MTESGARWRLTSCRFDKTIIDIGKETVAEYEKTLKKGGNHLR